MKREPPVLWWPRLFDGRVLDHDHLHYGYGCGAGGYFDGRGNGYGHGSDWLDGNGSEEE